MSPTPATFAHVGTDSDVPEWVLNEQKEFEKVLDKNKDGK